MTVLQLATILLQEGKTQVLGVEKISDYCDESQRMHTGWFAITTDKDFSMQSIYLGRNISDIKNRWSEIL